MRLRPSVVDLAPGRRPAIFHTRAALVLGFGGLLVLLVFSGLDAVQVLSQMRAGNDEVRREFLDRAGRLEQIRSAVYLSGTYVRDYLLEPEPGNAEGHRASLGVIHRRIETEVAGYERLVHSGEREPIRVLNQELERYWLSIDPIFTWSPKERHDKGYAFLRTQVLPRRQNMLSIADRIASVNTQELTDGDRRLNELFVSFRNRLLTVLAVTLLLGVAQATVSIRQILRLERSTARHLEEVSLARAELKELSARLVEVQENERKVISRELHDAVGQSLSAVLFELRNLSAEVTPDQPAILSHIDTMRKLLEGSVHMVRNMALLLRPSMLDDLGLAPALEWQARDVSKRTGLVINVAGDDLSEDLSDEHKTCIYRVVQEALNNVAKHAEAKNVRITVEQRPGELALSIYDDGKGFRLGEQRGLGIIGIHERVENLGGTVRLESEPGRGSLLVITLPLSGAETGVVAG